MYTEEGTGHRLQLQNREDTQKWQTVFWNVKRVNPEIFTLNTYLSTWLNYHNVYICRATEDNAPALFMMQTRSTHCNTS